MITGRFRALTSVKGVAFDTQYRTCILKGMVGRPIECDRDEAARQATLRFWRDGFSGTSVADIVADTGLNRFCLYGEFGGKKGLFLKACEIYSQTGAEKLLRPMLEAGDARSGLLGFFTTVAATLTDPATPGGCLMADAVREEDPEIRAAVRRHFEAVEAAFFTVLQRAAGMTGRRDAVPGAAVFLVTALLGLVQSARLGHSRERIEASARTAVEAALRVVHAV
jgi:AcrR family transcriptional regulator